MEKGSDRENYFLIKKDKEYYLVPMEQQQKYLKENGYEGVTKQPYRICEYEDGYKVLNGMDVKPLTTQSFEELKKAEIRSSKLTISDIVKCNNRNSGFDIFAVPNQWVDPRRCSKSGKQYLGVVEQMIEMIMVSRTEYINNNKEKIQSLLDSGSRENQIIDSIDKKLMQDRNLMNTLNNLRMTANQLYCEDQYCDNMRRSFYYTVGLLDENNQFDLNGVVKNNRQRTFFDDFTKVVLGNPNLVLNLLKWYDKLDLGLWEYFIKKEPGGDNLISINCSDNSEVYHFKKVIDLNQPYYERHYTKYKIITQDKKRDRSVFAVKYKSIHFQFYIMLL